MYIILDGHFTSMCWFHADMEACTLVSIASTLMLIVPGSFLLLDVLGDVTSNCVFSTRLTGRTVYSRRSISRMTS